MTVLNVMASWLEFLCPNSFGVYLANSYPGCSWACCDACDYTTLGPPVVIWAGIKRSCVSWCVCCCHSLVTFEKAIWIWRHLPHCCHWHIFTHLSPTYNPTDFPQCGCWPIIGSCRTQKESGCSGTHISTTMFLEGPHRAVYLYSSPCNLILVFCRVSSILCGLVGEWPWW